MPTVEVTVLMFEMGRRYSGLDVWFGGNLIPEWAVSQDTSRAMASSGLIGDSLFAIHQNSSPVATTCPLRKRSLAKLFCSEDSLICERISEMFRYNIDSHTFN